MATDPTEILNRRNAEVAQIRGFVDFTEEAKNRRIAGVNERARA
jgi:predicted nucleotidyltransferase